MPPVVFVDAANVFKLAASELPRYVPRQQSVQWGPLSLDLTVYDLAVVNPNERITNNLAHRSEADLLPVLAAHGKAGTVRFVTTIESLFEFWGHPKTDSLSGRFYGAPVSTVEAPVQFALVVGQGVDTDQEQMDFLCSITDTRFLAIQRATGACQGERPRIPTQMLDAFHLWCAEHNQCDYFLTLDYALIRALEGSSLRTSVRAIKPSDLLLELPSLPLA